jgi:putative SOS response-associated peptidase YedK
MCGRFSQAQIAELDREIARLLEAPPLEPRYNVAPTQDAAVVRERPDGGDRMVHLLRWGLIPRWARDPAIGNRMINARSETASEKPAFKTPFLRQRCLVPVGGFYEWQKTGGAKQPYFIRRHDGRPLLLAGLWDRWEGGPEEPVDSFTILTTEPNEVVAPIHNRMPVILPREHHDAWLDPANRDVTALRALLWPFAAGEMTAYPVSRYVNSPKNEGPECVSPADP